MPPPALYVPRTCNRPRGNRPAGPARRARRGGRSDHRGGRPPAPWPPRHPSAVGTPSIPLAPGWPPPGWGPTGQGVPLQVADRHGQAHHQRGFENHDDREQPAGQQGLRRALPRDSSIATWAAASTSVHAIEPAWNHGRRVRGQQCPQPDGRLAVPALGADPVRVLPAPPGVHRHRVGRRRRAGQEPGQRLGGPVGA